MKPRTIFIFAILVFAFASLTVGCRAESDQQPLDSELRRLLEDAGINYTSLAPGPPASAAKIVLGEALFFDKELSGNRDTSCATCHHPLMHTSDGLSLPIGVGGHGLGSEERRGGKEYRPRW